MVMLPNPISSENKEVNGRFVIVEQYADGTYGEKDVQTGDIELHHPDGRQQHYVLSDNNEYWLEREKLADGSLCAFYSNGNKKIELSAESILSETSKVRHIKAWYDNGQQAFDSSGMLEFQFYEKLELDKKEELYKAIVEANIERITKDIRLVRPYKKWYKNGNLMEEQKIKDGAEFKYDEIGILIREKYRDKIGYEYANGRKDIVLPTGDTIKMGNTTSAFKDIRVQYSSKTRWEYRDPNHMFITDPVDGKLLDCNATYYYEATVKITNTDGFDEVFYARKHKPEESYGTKTIDGYTISFDSEYNPLKKIEKYGATYTFSYKEGVVKTQRDGSIKQWDGKGNLRYEELKDKTKIYRNSDGNVISIYTTDGKEYHWDNDGNEIKEPIKREFSGYDLRKETTADGTEIKWYDGNMESLALPDGTYREWNHNVLIKENLPDGTEREWNYFSKKLTREKLPDGSEQKWNKKGTKIYQKLSDGSEQRWNNEGTKIYQKLSDGKTYEWFDDGSIKSYYSSDGTGYSNYENGNKKREVLPDGTIREWLPHGYKSEKYSDGTLLGWYHTGQKAMERLPNGIYHHWNLEGELVEEKTNREWRVWNDNGQMRFECLLEGEKTIKDLPHLWTDVADLGLPANINGIIREWYDNGKSKTEKLPDGTERKWYENGRLEKENLPDGTKRSWFKNGKLEYEKLSDGTIREWYDNGFIKSEKLPDGTVRTGDNDGNGEAIFYDGTKRIYKHNELISEKLSNGTVNNYNNGKLSLQILPDGTRREYKNGVLEKESLPDGTQKYFYSNKQIASQLSSDGSSVGWYVDGSKKFAEKPNGSRQEWHLNGKLSKEILCSDDKRKISEARYDENGNRTHFEHYDKDGKDDTRLYLAKQKVAKDNVDKGTEKGKVQKKLNPISKAWKLHKALKEVDAGK